MSHKNEEQKLAVQYVHDWGVLSYLKSLWDFLKLVNEVMSCFRNNDTRVEIEAPYITPQ